MRRFVPSVFAALAVASVSLAQYTPPDMGTIELPLSTSSVATQVLTVGGGVLAVGAAITIGFVLIKKLIRRVAGSA